MSVTAILTPEAKADVAEAAAWYRGRSTRAADDFLLAVGAALTRIELQPTAQMVIDAGPGGDIAQICRAAEAERPGLRTRMTEPLAAHPLLIEVLAERLAAAREI